MTEQEKIPCPHCSKPAYRNAILMYGHCDFCEQAAWLGVSAEELLEMDDVQTDD